MQKSPLHHITSLVFATIAAVLALAGCSEGKHDYIYCVTNSTDADLEVIYHVVGAYQNDTIVQHPGQTDTLCLRGNVSGDDVWNIETGRTLYQLTTLEAIKNGNTFADSLTLTKNWGDAVDMKGLGVYNLSITNDMFGTKNVGYYFYVSNYSNKTLYARVSSPKAYADTVVEMFALSPLESAYLFGNKGINLRQKNVADVLAESKEDNISYLKFETVFWLDSLGTPQYPKAFNPQHSSEWVFQKMAVGTDTIGQYGLVLTIDNFK